MTWTLQAFLTDKKKPVEAGESSHRPVISTIQRVYSLQLARIKPFVA